jgi:DNA-binding NarL/FixJ family response regulator
MTSTLSDPVGNIADPATERRRLDVLVSAPFPTVRRGIASLLAEFPDLAPRTDPAFDGTGQAPQPDVLVVYQPSGAIGVELAETAQSPHPLVLIVEGVLAELPNLSTRPLALVPAEVDGETLHTAVLAVSQGLTVIDTTFASSAGISWRQPQVPQGDTPDQLTARETQVLNLVASGMPNKTIAAQLDISEHTVKFHVGSILGKLGAESRTEAVTIATRRGLVAI